MRIHRGYLFWGIVFVLLGGIPLAERAGLIEADRLSQVGRLWPLLLIAIGVAIVVARTRLSLLGTLVSAVVIGGLAGSALAYGSGWALNITDCTGGSTADLARSTQQGSFSGPATVELQLNCGSLDLKTGPLGPSLGDWSLEARTRDAAPEVSSTGTVLRVHSPENTARRQEWDLLLASDAVRAIAIKTNAGAADVNVVGATLDSLSIEANAADTRVMAEDATIGSLSVQANAARARITAGGGGAILLEANAASVELCVPPTAALTVVVKDGFALVTNLEERDLTQAGDTWQRAGTGGPTILVQLDGNASTFTLDPEGGCA